MIYPRDCDVLTHLEKLYIKALSSDYKTHSSVLAWRIPGTGEPGGLPSMGSHRVGHDMTEQQQQLNSSHSEFKGRNWNHEFSKPHTQITVIHIIAGTMVAIKQNPQTHLF